ncbi:unnamed protein product [Schistosoma curassoni]|uniref:Uncharacterized protein n=1 Tax=Schistosoma curassoni TaxID=6186 RepID=A0A183K3I8_9TREM|nr:unnamed protein product [Schistosoma curassoni]
MHVSSHLGLVSWMYLHSRVDVHFGTRTQYRSLQIPSCYPLRTSRTSWILMLATIHFRF